MAVARGVPQPTVDATVRDIDSAPVAPKLRALLHYAAKLSRDPASVRRADVDELCGTHGWSEQAVCDAALVTATFNWYLRMAEATGLRGKGIDFATANSVLIKLVKKGVRDPYGVLALTVPQVVVPKLMWIAAIAAVGFAAGRLTRRR